MPLIAEKAMISKMQWLPMGESLMATNQSVSAQQSWFIPLVEFHFAVIRASGL
jgi:hypothetical protein